MDPRYLAAASRIDNLEKEISMYSEQIEEKLLLKNLNLKKKN